MTRRLEIPAEVIHAIREEAERPLSLDEFHAWADGPIGDDERRETAELIRWHLRRYPTGEARLAHARRAYRRWAASRSDR